MRRQAERWGAELFQEDVEFLDVKSSPFTIRSSEREVMIILSARFILTGFLCMLPSLVQLEK